MSTNLYEPSFDGGHMMQDMRGRHSHVRKPITRRARDTAQRHAMIAEAAYFRAQRRGFEPGHELEDWLQAEAALRITRA